MTEPLDALEQDVIAGLRLAALLLAIDAKVVDEGEPGAATEDKLIRAGSALGLWADRDRAVALARLTDDRSRWHRTISVLRHQLDYLRLLTRPPGDPAAQASTDPVGYMDFLRGVAAGHAGHARTFADLPQLRDGRGLLDLGGGLGAFSRAWVESQPHRTAVLADLPQLEPAIAERAEHPRIRTAGVDLLELRRLPAPADVILLSNVLHLFAGWRDVLRRVLAMAPAGARVCVFEATAESGPGALFDLQVHIRSGWSAGLLDSADVMRCLQAASAEVEDAVRIRDPDDPYRRDYTLWIARRSGCGQRATGVRSSKLP